VKGQPLFLILRPEDIAINAREQERACNGNAFEGDVIETIYLGNLLECRVRVGGYEVNVQIDHYEQFAPQQRVVLSFAPAHGLCLTE